MAGRTVTIDVIVADHEEIFRLGMAELLAGADDIRVLDQPSSPEQLLESLRTVTPRVLILSTGFLPAFSEIEKLLRRRHTALLMLVEQDDRIAYARWLGARGIVSRSADGPLMLEAIYRVARGELFDQYRNDPPAADPLVPECSICHCEIDSDCEELRKNIAMHVIHHAADAEARHKRKSR